MATKLPTPGRAAAKSTTTARQWVRAFGGTSADRLDLQADLALAKAVEEGLPTQAIDAAVKGGIVGQQDIHQLVVTKRTLQRRRDEEQRLNAEESDRLARLIRVIARAEVALDDSRKAESWMREPNRALQGRRPMDLLTSDMGARAVEKVLGRIEHGIYS
jgi:putative toxin-antitoxin system antitoxin component (TIGR02293 family)